jgi:V8-like Glu-specific endopeptidase
MKSKTKGLITLAISIVSLSASARSFIGGGMNKAIYGSNNIFATHKIQDPHKRVLAQSTALMISRYLIQPAFVDGLYMMGSNKLKMKAPVCDDNPWKEYNALGTCSATLVAPDKLLTAGHCISKHAWDCVQKSYVFDARQDFYTNSKMQYFTEDQIYHCKSVIAHKLDANTGMDYAIVQLDRKVSRTPINLYSYEKSEEKEGIFMIGHPLGLGSMTSDTGAVRSVEDENFYVGAIDSFAGNSGAPVFKSDSLSITGMLVRGEEDFTWNNEKRCFNFKICGENECRGEDIIKIERILEEIEQEGINLRH